MRGEEWRGGETETRGEEKRGEKSAKPPTMDSFEETLAELVRKYKHLYVASMPEHSNRTICDNSWWEIAETLGVPEKVCRDKWQSLRDRFSKAKKRLQAKKSGDAGGKRNIIPQLYTQLQWLDGFIKHRPTTSNMPASATQQVSFPASS